MDLDRVLQALGVDADDVEALALYRSLTDTTTEPLPGDWQVLAAAIVRTLTPAPATSSHRLPPSLNGPWPAWNEVSSPLLLGVSGGQGSGKSTLARAMVRGLEVAGARAAACSLDDFYLSAARRRELARSVHPLLATRGVPGTHDLALLEQVIDGLGRPGEVRLPVFDKGANDVVPAQHWRKMSAPLDVLVLEGWCVGARAQTDRELRLPVNELESSGDPDGAWRRYVNDALAGAYATLWDRLHLLVYLQVPDLQAVGRWRGEQEQSLPADRRMSVAALSRFIAHYERITRSMQADLPSSADVLVRLDESHAVVEVRSFRVRSA